MSQRLAVDFLSCFFSLHSRVFRRRPWHQNTVWRAGEHTCMHTLLNFSFKIIIIVIILLFKWRQMHNKMGPIIIWHSPLYLQQNKLSYVLNSRRHAHAHHLTGPLCVILPVCLLTVHNTVMVLWCPLHPCFARWRFCARCAGGQRGHADSSFIVRNCGAVVQKKQTINRRFLLLSPPRPQSGSEGTFAAFLLELVLPLDGLQCDVTQPYSTH